jgi:Domain of unknown function (DUF4124)
MARETALLLLFFSMSLPARADDVFRWIDDDGKVHYGESVPGRYKQNARKVDLTGVGGVSDAQRQEAEARLAKEKAKVDSLQRAREEKAEAAPSATPSPPDVPQAVDECQDQMKKYLASQECFAPYRRANGSLSPEAFEQCTDVKQPMGCFSPPSDITDRPYLAPPP